MLKMICPEPAALFDDLALNVDEPTSSRQRDSLKFDVSCRLSHNELSQMPGHSAPRFHGRHTFLKWKSECETGDVSHSRR
jgi:hypothetical protein